LIGKERSPVLLPGQLLDYSQGGLLLLRFSRPDLASVTVLMAVNPDKSDKRFCGQVEEIRHLLSRENARVGLVVVRGANSLGVDLYYFCWNCHFSILKPEYVELVQKKLFLMDLHSNFVSKPHR